ncbi:fimbrial biogenesis chaperone [Pedobacter psychroterrae]|uniref:P pilus assembly chaperone PapD n=1 Tax=Pedobacter psychroterrae TaxID=2530453 RepID=A0A4V2MK34_9SPHI|nr:hypothetical protein [Pedobacter psychroterrae]TCC96756.1 hypothetical protein EZ437_21245 [Pedobacter psychroterrae]
MKTLINICVIGLIFFSNHVYAQAGITVSPGKVYFKSATGEPTIQKIQVSNPNNRELQVGVSLSDWSYDAFGNNIMHDANTIKTSCTNWIEVLPGSYFTLGAREQREVTISITPPPDTKTDVGVHTAMIFFTQLNPGDARREDGSMIKVSVRMGVKVYHSFPQPEKRNMEVLNFIDKIDPQHKELPGYLELEVENTSNIWLDSKIKLELLNTQTGAKEKINNVDMYSLPGDKRTVRITLPANLKKGKYNATAVISYGNKDELKVVELEFER